MNSFYSYIFMSNMYIVYILYYNTIYKPRDKVKKITNFIDSDFIFVFFVKVDYIHVYTCF